MFSASGISLSFVTALGATLCRAQDVNGCPGYTASDVVQTDSGLTASLQLAGDACNAYGYELPDLALLVEYQTGLSYQRVMIDVTYR